MAPKEKGDRGQISIQHGQKEEASDSSDKIYAICYRPFFRRIFCVRYSSVVFGTLIEPRHISIIRLVGSNGHHIFPLVRVYRFA